MDLYRLNAILADVAAPQSAPGMQPSPFDALKSQLPFFLLIGVIFYFILIRPQQLRAKQQAKLIANLKSGDKVVTSSGIVGVVITVKEQTVSLRSMDAKMEVTKSSVTEILKGGDAVES
jgi:preprotein translocase subunit YajC